MKILGRQKKADNGKGKGKNGMTKFNEGEVLVQHRKEGLSSGYEYGLTKKAKSKYQNSKKEKLILSFWISIFGFVILECIVFEYGVLS